MSSRKSVGEHRDNTMAAEFCDRKEVFPDRDSAFSPNGDASLQFVSGRQFQVALIVVLLQGLG